MSRPTIYLTNASSTKWHGPGRMICAMANPAKHHRGDGRCLACAPFGEDLARVRDALAGPDDAGQHRAALARYRGAFEAGCDYRAMVGRYTPGALSFVTWTDPDGRASEEKVADGDTLFCSCARPGSAKRRSPCHLETLVPYLVRAGWDVMLDGKFVTIGEDGPVWQFDGSFEDPYRPESFGWPEAA